MITGFNTDIEHNGTVYHVQTEDKGLETPIILSLVYVGGAILASKRAPYADLVDAGFDAALLDERLRRQHKLICAAISAGRIEDLKRLSLRETSELAASRADVAVALDEPRQIEQAAKPEATRVEKPRVEKPRVEKPLATPEVAEPAAKKAEPAAQKEVTLHEASPVVSAKPTKATKDRNKGAPAEVIPAEIDDELHLSLLEEKDFRAGEIITLRVMVTRGAFGVREIVRDAGVTVKVLGTEFRPLILTSKTDADGVAVVHVWLPRFSSGRAAILIRAAADGCAAELRRVIHHT